MEVGAISIGLSAKSTDGVSATLEAVETTGEGDSENEDGETRDEFAEDAEEPEIDLQETRGPRQTTVSNGVDGDRELGLGGVESGGKVRGGWFAVGLGVVVSLYLGVEIEGNAEEEDEKVDGSAGGVSHGKREPGRLSSGEEGESDEADGGDGDDVKDGGRVEDDAEIDVEEKTVGPILTPELAFTADVSEEFVEGDVEIVEEQAELSTAQTHEDHVRRIEELPSTEQKNEEHIE